VKRPGGGPDCGRRFPTTKTVIRTHAHLKCRLCKASFRTEYLKTEHMRKKHRLWQCCICEERFSSRDLLRLHAVTALGTSSWATGQLLTHTLRASKKKKKPREPQDKTPVAALKKKRQHDKCRHCAASLGTDPRQREAHVWKRHNLRECPVCWKHFPTKNSLLLHKRTAKGTWSWASGQHLQHTFNQRGKYAKAPNKVKTSTRQQVELPKSAAVRPEVLTKKKPQSPPKLRPQTPPLPYTPPKVKKPAPPPPIVKPQVAPKVKSKPVVKRKLQKKPEVPQSRQFFLGKVSKLTQKMATTEISMVFFSRFCLFCH